MEVHFTPEQETRLALIAANAGTVPERLVKDAALRLLPADGSVLQPGSGGIIEAMRTLRARIQPDPEGWTVRDYVLHGRR